MAEETPAEQEDRLQRREERLEKQHARLKDPPPKGGGNPKTSSVSEGVSGILSFFEDHKIALLAVGAIFVLVAVVIFIQQQNSNSTNSANAANDTGTAQNPGYQDVGTAYSLDQLTQQLDAIQQQLGTSTTTGSTTTTTTTGSGSGSTTSNPPPKTKSAPTYWPSADGLLGPGIRILIQNGQYLYRSENQGPTNTHGGFLPVPLPSGTKYKPGAQGRYYYETPGTNTWKLLGE